jgi:Fe-S-cluster containining protein
MIPAFSRGVRFGCTQCGQCCTGLRHPIPLLIRDVERLASHLGLSPQTFVDRHCTHIVDRVRDGRTTTEIPTMALTVPASGRCTFLAADGTCGVHEAKPTLCRLSPFVASVAEGEAAAWREIVRTCPGIGRGPRYSPARIRRHLADEARAESDDFERIQAAGGNLPRAAGVLLPGPMVRDHAVRNGRVEPVARRPAAPRSSSERRTPW